MNEHDRVGQLTRLGRRLVAEEMKKPDMLGGALHGALALGRNWPTSDLDYCVFPQSCRPPAELGRIPAYRHYNDRGLLLKHHLYAELRVVDDVYVNLSVKTKTSIDELMSGYPGTFIESAESIPDMHSTFFLDGLAIMTILEDPTGYLGRVKGFVAKHRFSPDVVPARLRAMFMTAQHKLAEAQRLVASGKLDLGPRYDLAQCIGQMWLEARGHVYSKKEQDVLLAEAASEAGVPEVHHLYRATLGLDVPKNVLQDLLEPIASYAVELDGMIQVLEKFAAERIDELGEDFLENCKAQRLSTALSLQSIPVAFEKGCHAHIAFVLQKLGPVALADFLMVLKYVAPPSQFEGLEAACQAGLERRRGVWEFFGHIAGADAKASGRLEAASQLLELTGRKLLSQ